MQPAATTVARIRPAIVKRYVRSSREREVRSAVGAVFCGLVFGTLLHHAGFFRPSPRALSLAPLLEPVPARRDMREAGAFNAHQPVLDHADLHSSEHVGFSAQRPDARSVPEKLSAASPKEKSVGGENVPETKHYSAPGREPDMDAISARWRQVIEKFMSTSPPSSYAAHIIEKHFENNVNDIQSHCILVQVKHGRAAITANFSPKKHGRFESAKYMIEKVVQASNGKFPDVTFIVMLNDGIKPKVPTLGSARHWKSWKKMIPVPLGNVRGEKVGWGTPLKGWNQYVQQNVVDSHAQYPWESKKKQAVFRGSLLMQTHALGTCNIENDGLCVRARTWKDIARGRMYIESRARPELFNITFTKHTWKESLGPEQFEGAPEPTKAVDFRENQAYKLIINVGSNQDWAERLRLHMFMNSALVIHQAETEEFFHPLLVAWKHYIPTSLMFDDLVQRVEWALSHDDETKSIMQNMGKLARDYLSEESMEEYWRIVMTEFANLQKQQGTSGSFVEADA